MVLDHRPDVVILDGKMPRLDGLAVPGAIKASPELADILVAMLTGRGQFFDLEKGVKPGTDALMRITMLRLAVPDHTVCGFAPCSGFQCKPKSDSQMQRSIASCGARNTPCALCR